MTAPPADLPPAPVPDVDELPLWSHSVGELPHKVTAFEHALRGRTLYLKWRTRDASGRPNWAHQSLGRRLRTTTGTHPGRIIRGTEQWATQQARAKYEQLIGAMRPEERPQVPLTILQGLERACDKETGKYPRATPHRREVSRSLRHAARLLGEALPFNAIRRSHLRKLWRLRHDELVAGGHLGVRGAEIVVTDLLAVAEWLRSEDLIDEGACVGWKNWKTAMRHEVDAPDPRRPRHTVAEALAIMDAAWRVDPRLGLALALGAELRGGQVIRCRRSDLDLEADTLTVRGRGRKQGTVVHLTRGQRAAVDRALGGYLGPLEASALDYPLFPAGKLGGRREVGTRGGGRGRKGYTRVPDGPLGAEHLRARPQQAEAGPIDRSRLDDWFELAEGLAGVEHVEGRSWYGLRRVFLDAATEAGLSPEAIQEHGGWADQQVPNQIYRNKERVKARDQARDARARYRGEAPEAGAP